MYTFWRSTAKKIIATPGFKELEKEYGDELGIEQFGQAKANLLAYEDEDYIAVTAMEESNDPREMPVKIVGFAVLHKMPPQTHYPDINAYGLDSLFLSKAHRKGRTGLNLIKHALGLAKEQGAESVILTAQKGSRFSALLRGAYGLKPITEVYCLDMEKVSGRGDIKRSK